MPEISLLVILEKWKQFYQHNKNHEIRTVQFKWVSIICVNLEHGVKTLGQKSMKLGHDLISRGYQQHQLQVSGTQMHANEKHLPRLTSCIRYQSQNHCISDQEVWTTLDFRKQSKTKLLHTDILSRNGSLLR